MQRTRHEWTSRSMQEAAFQASLGSGRGPRQGRNMRLCIIRRELLPRQLLFRVVRIKTPPNTPGEARTVDERNGNKHGSARDGRKGRSKKNEEKSGPPSVRIGPGNGRSAYISKELSCVMEATRKNRLSKALRCRIPTQVTTDLRHQAEEWDKLPNDIKGLFFCEVYNLDGAFTPTEQVQHCMLSTDDIAEDLALE